MNIAIMAAAKPGTQYHSSSGPRYGSRYGSRSGRSLGSHSKSYSKSWYCSASGPKAGN